MATDHPDARLIEQTRAALYRWECGPLAAPTSQLTGGGAIERAERRLSGLHAGRASILMPSATFGLRAVLVALGIRTGHEVLIPRLDWTAALAAVRSVGASPVIVSVDPQTMTIDPARAAKLRSSRTRAVIASHLHGIPADVPALRHALPWLTVIEDVAQALGSTLDGERTGTLGDVAVFSFGPGKGIDAGELGAVLTGTDELHERVLRSATHPIRQHLSGVRDIDVAPFTVRPHPLAAILLDDALAEHNPDALVAAQRELASRLRTSRYEPLGDDDRRGIAASFAVVDGDVEREALPSGLTAAPIEVFDVDAVAHRRPASRRLSLVTEERG